MILHLFYVYSASMPYGCLFLPPYGGNNDLRMCVICVVMETLPPTELFEALCCELLTLEDHRDKVQCLLRLRDILRTGMIPP